MSAMKTRVGLVVVCAAASVALGAEDWVLESTREMPVAAEVDVFVAGGTAAVLKTKGR